MNSSLASLAGLLFFAGVAVVMGYYLAFYIPYTASLAKYYNDLTTYNVQMESCYAEVGEEFIPCTTEADCVPSDERGVVAGCADIPMPDKPNLPFAKVINILGDYTNIQALKEAGKP